jgi:hypothetical protein
VSFSIYSGLATTPAVRDLIEQLIAQPDTESLAEVLTEAYFSGGSELSQDRELRRRVLERVAISPEWTWKIPGIFEETKEPLSRFPKDEVAVIGNTVIGTTDRSHSFSKACFWLVDNPKMLEVQTLE